MEQHEIMYKMEIKCKHAASIIKDKKLKLKKSASAGDPFTTIQQ